eukprot:TRINITY_DN70535_c0_g1_i1.p1 TRINITY_DN70535_c0_g1~~TRINITY_DN70535_c0_g1_i1.p1  ORF type:complete len:318 (+),score=95.80 TRINITY_DN70535_c0_g1_i1:43-996(+)
MHSGGLSCGAGPLPMPFGQLVFGHPGAGKTTYCAGLKTFLARYGRDAAVVNLDPANDALPYECAIDIRHLCDHSEAMRSEALGPNGAFVFCVEYLVANEDWLMERLQAVARDGRAYLLFDCPGQVELYTQHAAFRSLVDWLQRAADIRLCAVHLVDSLHVRSAPHYISALLLSLTSMLQLELPHVNVLSKVDLLSTYDLPLGIDFYTEVQDLSHLVGRLSSAVAGLPERFRDLTERLAELMEDFPHVSFSTLAIEDERSVRELVELIDKANGYSFAPLQLPSERAAEQRLHSAAADDIEGSYRHRFEELQRARRGGD